MQALDVLDSLPTPINATRCGRRQSPADAAPLRLTARSRRVIAEEATAGRRRAVRISRLELPVSEYERQLYRAERKRVPEVWPITEAPWTSAQGVAG